MAEDLTGLTFGRLYVVRRYEHDYITPSTGYHTSKWVCKCTCGNDAIVTSTQLKSGKTQSCGCLQRERTARANTRHGGRYERLHMVWANMKNRCFNPKYAEYDNYGGRGITVCDEWLEYPAFRKWAIGAGYNSDAERGKYTLDRIDVDGNYSPDNCRFVDMFAQANNKKNNFRVEYNGEEHTLAEWSRILEIPYNTLYDNITRKGKTINEILQNV